MADTSVRGSSIPPSRRTVKATISEACSGLPVTERDYTVTLGVEITADQVAGMLSGLWFAEQRVLVRVRFKVGDIWNQLKSNGFGVLRKTVLSMLRAKMSDEQYQRTLRRFHNYAWVCRKWPEGERHDHKPWSFFVENDPGENPVTPKVESRIMLRITRRYVHEGREYIECCGRSDREYLAVELPAAESDME